MIPVTLTIAGSDSGGGAGIQADLKTFQELKTFGTSVITALTAQNTMGVHNIHSTPTSFVIDQLDALLDDFKIDAIKTGMLFSAEIIETIAKRLQHVSTPIIVDPVMIAKGGSKLLQDSAVNALIEYLLPISTVVTPNIPEAEILTKLKIQTIADVDQAAKLLLQMGPNVVIIKGGHLDDTQYAVDRAYFSTGEIITISNKRIETINTHGTGCTFSAALTAFIARGMTIEASFKEAKHFIHLAIKHDLNLGNGHGPTNHFAYNEAGKNTVKSNG